MIYFDVKYSFQENFSRADLRKNTFFSPPGSRYGKTELKSGTGEGFIFFSISPVAEQEMFHAAGVRGESGGTVSSFPIKLSGFLIFFLFFSLAGNRRMEYN